MNGNDPAFVEAARLARKFFPEAEALIPAEVGLDWDAFLGAMMTGDYSNDYSCDSCRQGSDTNLGLLAKGGFEGGDAEIYVRLLCHAELAPSGRAVVIPDALGSQDWSLEECPPFVCDESKVATRLNEIGCCFGQARDTIFVFESGEAMLIDHDERLHWTRSKINRRWDKP